MKKNVLFTGILLTLFFVYSFSPVHASSVPQLINYQGMLTDAEGNPLPTKEYKLSFKIFTVASGGTEVWGPQTFDGDSKVPVVKGHFNVILGPKDANGRNIVEAFVSDKSYLEITVGDGQPILPRQHILSTPYAIKAGNGNPVGTIIASMLNETLFAQATGDEGITDASKRKWTLADGKPVQGSRYAEIMEKNNKPDDVPDLRGMFLRGVDLGRGIDPGRTVGGPYQIDTTRLPRGEKGPFTGTTSANGAHSHRVKGAGNEYSGGTDDRHKRATYNPTAITTIDGNHSHTVTITSGGDSETRPANVAVYYYIRIN
ncbi:MAG: hypothetical protein MRK01_05215 [Candidatus Scalindua sp.]|nr:hypothetical protein [Candidatus Scalindua sp.]